MINQFKLGVLVATGCLATFVSSGYFMAHRVRAYYDAVPPPQHLFKQFYIREFQAFGRPTKFSDDTTPQGATAMRIDYGDQSIVVPVHPPAAPNFSELSAYNEWLAVLAFAPMFEGRVKADPETGATDVRLVLAKRNPAPGQEDEPGGLVGRKLWTFDFVELLPEGGFATKRMQFRDRRGKLPALEADPASGVVAIEERSWEFQAALYTIPKLHISNYRYKIGAVQGSGQHEGMGWTPPASAVSVLGVVIGCGLMMGGRAAPRRTRA